MTDLETIERVILARMLFPAAPQKARDDLGKLAAARLAPGDRRIARGGLFPCGRAGTKSAERPRRSLLSCSGFSNR
jgi:hypothetical protein